MESWIASRLNSPHLLKVYKPSLRHSYTYSVASFVEGITLAQWVKDNPDPPLSKIRHIIGQLCKGLQTMHRHEMIHQDLRPENVMIDANEHVTIIDFGATQVKGLEEMAPMEQRSLAQRCLPRLNICLATSEPLVLIFILWVS